VNSGWLVDDGHEHALGFGIFEKPGSDGVENE
jgi:hypothetical protein